MKGERMFRILGLIDEDLIEEVPAGFSAAPPRRTPWKRYLAAAACLTLVCGLGFTGGLTFQVGGASITLTSLAIAAIAGIILNAILPGNDFNFGENTDSKASGSLGQY